MKEAVSKEEYFKFILVMIIFIIGMIGMMVYKIENLWIWIGYIYLWTWTEMKVAKNIHLKWTTWLWILLGLSVIDIFIIYLLH